MALQGSGAISIGNLATEFGGSTPHSLSEYYRGGGLVPNTGTNANVPTSGQISLSQFYGAAAYTNIYGVYRSAGSPDAYYLCVEDPPYVYCPTTVDLWTEWMTISYSGGNPGGWVSGWTHISGTALDNAGNSGNTVRFYKGSIGRGSWIGSTYRVYITDGISTGEVDIAMSFYYDFA
jgi:hypothetical protein